MKAIKELDLILTLIRKYNLPLSPILEYAVNEKIEEMQANETSEEEDDSNIDMAGENTDVINSPISNLDDVIISEKPILYGEKQSADLEALYNDVVSDKKEYHRSPYDKRDKRIWAVKNAMTYFKRPVKAKDVAKRISRTAWGNDSIRIDDVEKILYQIPDVKLSSDGRFFLKQ